MDNELAGQCRLLLATVVALVADEVVTRLEYRLITEDRVRALAEQQASAMFIDDRGDALPRAWSKETLLTLIAEQPTLDHEYVRQSWSKQDLKEMITDKMWTQKQIDDMVEQRIIDLCMVDADRVQELIDENIIDEDRVRDLIGEGFEELDDKIEEYLSNNLNDEVVTIVRDMDFKVTVR
jgi:hypothetical protein